MSCIERSCWCRSYISYDSAYKTWLNFEPPLKWSLSLPHQSGAVNQNTMIYVFEEKIETAGPNFLIVCLTHNVSVRETGQGFDRHRIETISWEICAIHLQRRQKRNFQKYPWKIHLKEGRGECLQKPPLFQQINDKFSVKCGFLSIPSHVLLSQIVLPT